MILQAIKCTEIDCKEAVCYLNYLDHFEENHGNCENLGDGKVFKSPIDFDKIQLICSNVNCKVVPNFETFKKCVYCLKVFCCQGKTLSGGGYNCGYHYCYRASDGAGMGYKSATQTDIGAGEKGKWLSKKFTAFNKTFFEVGIMRNNLIYKWIYVLALPHEAKKFQVHVTIKNAMGETVNDYHEQARSMVEYHDLIIEDERCFSLGIKKAKRYAMKDTNQVDYTVTIRNLKDEAKDEDEESGIDD